MDSLDRHGGRALLQIGTCLLLLHAVEVDVPLPPTPRQVSCSSWCNEAGAAWRAGGRLGCWMRRPAGGGAWERGCTIETRRMRRARGVVDKTVVVRVTRGPSARGSSSEGALSALRAAEPASLLPFWVAAWPGRLHSFFFSLPICTFDILIHRWQYTS